MAAPDHGRGTGTLLGRRLAAAASAPMAPPYAAALSYRVYHPPRRRPHKEPGTFGLASEEHWVDVDGGVRLHVWLCPGATAGHVVVVGHGVGLSKSASLAHARLLHEAGYTVCLFDHRNHGLSTQDRCAWGQSRRFTDDVQAVVRAVRDMPAYADARVAVYGFSFSSFPVFYVLGRADCGVDAVVCDSGPAATIRPLFSNFLDSGALPIPGPLRTRPARGALAWAFSSLSTAMLHTTWPPRPDGAYARTPMLFLAGEDDAIIPAHEVRAFAAAYPGAEVRVLPGTPHLAGLKTDPDAYAEAVLGFLARALGPVRAS